jgi:hypothetical protein
MAGRPNSSAALGEFVRGMRAAKAAFMAFPEIVRDNMLSATETTVRLIASGAQARLLSSPSVQTRALYSHVAWSVTKTNGRGRVGVTSGSTTVSNLALRKTVKVKGIIRPTASGGYKVVKPSRYGPKVEFGTRYMKAEPFMRPAAESQAQAHIRRCKDAGRGIERDMAAVGQRNI